MRRREFLSSAAASSLLRAGDLDFPRTIPDWQQPMFRLHEQFKAPVRIASIEYLRNGKVTFVRAVSTDGVAGVVRAKEIEDFVPILNRKVIPAFVKKDARDLESLIDQVYIANYKIAGQPFWSPVGTVEQAIWDMLGRTANKPVAALMGGVLRKEIPVYLSGSGRETTAEEEVDVYVRAVAETNTKAVKFKIGGRMSYNQDPYPGRTQTMMELARKRLGDSAVLYADANGAYDSKAGIVVGKWLQGLGVQFFEEPCPWEQVEETKRVADTLQIQVAGGEQDSSLPKFQDMISRKVLDIVQPDLNYCGGMIRAARVARMARAAGITIVPHNTQTDSAGCKILQFAAATPNIGAKMEFPYRGVPKEPTWYTPHFVPKDGVIPVPTGPGFGVDFDPAFLSAAQRIES